MKHRLKKRKISRIKPRVTGNLPPRTKFPARNQSPSLPSEAGGEGRGEEALIQPEASGYSLQFIRSRRHKAMILHLSGNRCTTGSSMQRIPDFQQNAIPILSPLMIPKPKHVDALLFQEQHSLPVVVYVLRGSVRKAVQLNTKASFRTIKIQSVTANRMLPTKFEAGETTCAESLPDLFLLFGLFPTQAMDVSFVHRGNANAVRRKSKPPLPGPLLRLRSEERESSRTPVIVRAFSTMCLSVHNN
jgi:hypothetical protein